MENPEKCSSNASFSGRVYHCENGHPGKVYEIKKIFTPVPVGWVGGLVGGRVRKAKNKAKAQHSWGLGLAELGNKLSLKLCQAQV